MTILLVSFTSSNYKRLTYQCEFKEGKLHGKASLHEEEGYAGNWVFENGDRLYDRKYVDA